MPQIIDLQLFQAAQATTQPAWSALQGKFEQSQDFFNQGIAAREQASQALGESLKPVFSAAGSVISGGIQNLMKPAAASPSYQPQVGGQGGVMGQSVRPYTAAPVPSGSSWFFEQL